MTKQDIEGFLSNPFFAALNPTKEIDKDYLKSIFKNAFEDKRESDYVFQNIYRNYCANNKMDYYSDYDDFITDGGYINITKQVVLDYLLQEDALKYFCYEEDYDSIVKIIERKQLNANLIKQVLSRVSYVISMIHTDCSKLSLILNNDMKRIITKYNNDFIIKRMGNLKTMIDKATSGVSQKCYIEFGVRRVKFELSDKLIEYVKEKHGYDLSIREYDERKLSVSKVLSCAMVKDESFWKFGPYEKTLITFVGYVEKYNDFKHATKIIDFAFEEACKDKKIKSLYDNKLPFNLYYIEDDMINWSLNRLNIYLSKVVDFNITEEEMNGLIYPLYSGFDNSVSKGKELFEKFLKDVYPNDYNIAFKEFTNLDNVIHEERQINVHTFQKKLTIRDVIDYHVLGFTDVEEKTRYLSIFNKKFLDDESVLGRLYYRIFLISKYAKDLTNECLYEYLYEVLKVIEQKNNLKSSYVLDTKLRDENYLLLKDILANRDIIIDDSYKALYVTALLDRKYATAEEASMFAELEQFGDAIYELAVDNIIFYDPSETNKLEHQERENYVKAEGQMVISKTIGLDKAYISKLNNSINKKFEQYEAIEYGLFHRPEGHYLADSLEMVIGAIAKEFNVQVALDFATNVILESYPNLHRPVIFKNFDIQYLYNESKADRDYLNKIYPSPFLSENDYYSEYLQLSYALNKILKIAILGNDTVEKRKSIANSLNELIPSDRYDGYYQVVVSYLYYGIEETINKYRSFVESNYKQQ